MFNSFRIYISILESMSNVKDDVGQCLGMVFFSRKLTLSRCYECLLGVFLFVFSRKRGLNRLTTRTLKVLITSRKVGRKIVLHHSFGSLFASLMCAPCPHDDDDEASFPAPSYLTSFFKSIYVG